jgi:transcriptional regulator with XRE-family HTH domain
MKMDKLKLQFRLADLLKAQGLSQAELSRKSGVSKQVISQWLGGVEPRKVNQIKQVATVLNTSVDDLCFGPSENLPTTSNPNDFIAGIFEIRMRRIK